MRKAIDRSFLTRLLRTTALSLALMTASAAGVHAETVIVQGADGANGADNTNWEVGGGGNGASGGDASAIANWKTDSSNTANASGGDGGNGGEGGFGGTAGNGGNAFAIAVTMHAGDASATATGGNGGNGGDAAYWGGPNGGNGGDANAKSIATSAGSASVTSSASATGGNGGVGGIFLGGAPSLNGVSGNGGSATAVASAKSGRGSATAIATATGGATFSSLGFQPPYPGNATATSTATTNRDGVSVQSTATAGPTEGSITTYAVAQGGSGQASVNSDLAAYAFSIALPDEAYAATVIDGASNVADALLGPRDTILGIAILGEQGYGDSASSTFDFRFRGDLLLGLIDGSGEFSISANGVEILSESFVDDDSVMNLGSNFGPNIDLTFTGSGVFVVGGAVPGSAVPEPSTWAMMLLGFAGLGFARYRASRRTEPPESSPLEPFALEFTRGSLRCFPPPRGGD